MTTYTVTFDLAQAQTGVSGHYPVLVRNSTYAPDNTIYAKSGDTVKFVVSEPAPDGASVSYNNTNVADTDPDPDEFTAGTTNQNSPSSWEYTLGSSAEDAEFYWFYFGTTVHSSGSGKKYSQRVRVNRVSGSPQINGGTSAVTVTQGGTITFSVSGLSGLLPASGTADNFLYFSVFNSSNQWFTTHSSASGLNWDSSNNQLGKVKTTDTSTVLTVGSSMPTGTYNVYLTHFNAADSPGGNDFMGSEHRLSSTPLQFTVTTATGTNTDPSLGADVNAGTSLSQVYTTNSGAITCNPTSFTPTVSTSTVAGSSVNTKFRLKNANGTYPTTSYTSPPNTLTLTSGQSVDFQMTGPAGYSATNTGRLTIGAETDDVSITTSANPSGSGGGSGSGGATSGTYGLIIKNGATGNQIFGVGQKQGSVIASGSLGTIASGGLSAKITLPVAGTDNVSSKVGIMILDMYTTTSTSSYPAWLVYRNYNNEGADSFRAYNASLVSRPANYIVVRY